jgi:Arc/MetJ-type ribon-helix-helix transcriptional regulator
MQVTLEPHQEQAIEAAIRAGRLRSLEEFIESAVQTLAPQESPTVTNLPAVPAVVKVDGLWVHQGQAEASAHWDTVVEEVREERLLNLRKASHS